ncbi:MAG: lipopolysaccharide export system ATP-binding protein LptB [Armatimonadota bacterium]|nr:MAG: lipopolysaccharide export system ATP-binding protein LptB [Armatimonadota bacterium]
MSIVCQELVKSYRGRRVVNSLSFSAERGEVVGMLGPNGAGKTTTFYMILGLVRPESGRVLLDGYDITSQPIFRRSRLGIGYLPQEASIFRKLTVFQNVMLYLESRGVPAGQRREEAMRLLEDFGVADRANVTGSALSGGERRRVEIARALAANPGFLLLDEPFTGVDPIAISEIQQMIRKLASRGIGVVISDHNVRETLSITDRSYIVAEGRVVCSGTEETILNDPLARKHYLGENFTL